MLCCDGMGEKTRLVKGLAEDIAVRSLHGCIFLHVVPVVCAIGNSSLRCYRVEG